MQRKLATIQKVKDVVPVITGDGTVAENLELVSFYDIGWQCVAKKGDFQRDDLAVYVEISTTLPEHPVFEFMRPRKFKVKTMKFVKTTLSQGLVMPLSILNEFLPEGENYWHPSVGEDITELLGVKRYDAEALDNRTGGEQFGSFPEHILPKTDQERIQSMPFLLDRMKLAGDIVATLKVDGTSSTFYFDDDVLHACGRNVEHKPNNGSVYWKVAYKYSLEQVLRDYPHIAIQGEIAGPGIQKNRLGLQEAELFVFGVWDRRINNFYPYANMKSWCENVGLQYVEAVHEWHDGEFNTETIESLLELAKGNYKGTRNPREGLVIRPMYATLFDHRLGAALSFKVINNDYLLGGGE